MGTDSEGHGRANLLGLGYVSSSEDEEDDSANATTAGTAEDRLWAQQLQTAVKQESQVHTQAVTPIPTPAVSSSAMEGTGLIAPKREAGIAEAEVKVPITTTGIMQPDFAAAAAAGRAAAERAAAEKAAAEKQAAAYVKGQRYASRLRQMARMISRVSSLQVAT